MSDINVVVVNFHAGDRNEHDDLLAALVTGCESAGGAVTLFVLSDRPPAVSGLKGDAVKNVARPGETDGVLESLARADRAVLSVSGDVALRDSLLTAFVDEAYRKADWLSLGEAISDASGHSDQAAALESIRFPVTPAPCPSRRAISVVGPPPEGCDGPDPFCESRFFVLEEAARVLGFAPVGRILSTGLFYPRFDRNPMLESQAAEIGRRLVDGRIIAGASKSAD